jgi:hypothetical protein
VTIDQALDGLPKRALPPLALSLRSLHKLPSEDWPKLFDTAVETVFSQYMPDASELSEILGKPEGDVQELLNSASFLAALTTSFDELSGEEILSALVNKKLIESTDVQAFRPLLAFLSARKSVVARQLDKDELATQVLPNLRVLDLSVDVRLPAPGVPLSASAPVAVAMLDTDAEGQIVWFQLTKQQLQSMSRQIDKALAQMARAERLIAAVSDEPGVE